MAETSNPHPFGKTHPHLSEFVSFLPELNKESDRGVVLISCSFIDELLRRTLVGYLIQNEATSALLDGFNAPLGTFSSRIALCYALGLLSEAEYKECEIFRRIRNKFAHEIHISFDDQAISDMARNLAFAAQDYGDVVVGTKGRFATAATALILNLVNRPHYVSLERRKYAGWRY